MNPSQIEHDRYFVRLPSGEEFEITRQSEDRKSWKLKYVYAVQTLYVGKTELHGLYASEEAANAVAAGMRGATVERRELQ